MLQVKIVVCRGYELLNKSNNDGSDIFIFAGLAE
jgi:hypothetical protein